MKDKPNLEIIQVPTSSNWLNYIIALTKSGVLAIMSPTAVKVLWVLLSHRSIKTGGARIGYKKIMKEAGIGGVKTVYYALNQLQAARLITKRRQGPKAASYTNFYHIPLFPEIYIANLQAEVNVQKKHRLCYVKKT